MFNVFVFHHKCFYHSQYVKRKLSKFPKLFISEFFSDFHNIAIIKLKVCMIIKLHGTLGS